jgi:hypothetical protein
MGSCIASWFFLGMRFYFKTQVRKSDILYYAFYAKRLFLSFCYFRTFVGPNYAPLDLLQYVLSTGSQTKFLTKLWTLEKSRVWSVCMVTVIRARFAMTKPPFAQKPIQVIIFWTLKIGLSSSARVRPLKGILRRAHVTIFIVDYGDFQSQLSGFSRIFEDFDWAPVIFTQDV